MPPELVRLQINSTDEAALHALIRDPDAFPASEGVQDAAQRIHAFFVEERGWDAAELRRWRFRDLAAMCAGAEAVLARTPGTAAWARGQLDTTLRLALHEMAQATPSASAAVLERIVGVQHPEPLVERRMSLTAEEWAEVDRLVERVGVRGAVGQERVGPSRLGRQIIELLRRSYGRQ